jgi:hypothetical protein
MVQNFDVICGKLNIVGTYTNANYAGKWITKLYNY